LPACGAIAKYHQKCEYCGSLIVLVFQNNYELGEKPVEEFNRWMIETKLDFRYAYAEGK
jgi:hypothetical protein